MWIVPLLLLLFFSSYPGVLRAQSTSASVTGRVTDPSKAVIVYAKVAAINVGTNVRYEGATNASGEYYLTNLPPGSYRIEIEKAGFQKLIKPDVILHVQDVFEIDFQMTLGSESESITVEGGAPLVATTSSEISGLVNSKKIEDLPLNGRNYIDLSLLQAGVTNSLNSTGTNGFGGMTGTVYSSNGAPVISNNFLLDGTQITNQSDWGTASFAGTTLGVDGIQEYKVLTSGYDASYGMKMGSELVMVSRGGTNQYHGDVFEYLRNSAFNARNFFDGAKIPQLEKNNFGASFGGPIRKEKTFFYAVYEGLQENLGFTANDLVRRDRRLSCVERSHQTC
jgi:hypothetical protein